MTNRDLMPPTRYLAPALLALWGLAIMQPQGALQVLGVVLVASGVVWGVWVGVLADRFI